MPNKTCVRDDPLGLLDSSGLLVNATALTEPNGRWRAGALTLQLLDYDAIKSDIDNSVGADDRVYQLQSVSDLPNLVSLPTGIVSLQESGVSYGGVIVNPYLTPNAAFLYEATLFWHVSVISCYGSGDWETQRNLTLLTIFKFNEFLATVSAALLADIFFSGGEHLKPQLFAINSRRVMYRSSLPGLS